MIHDLALPAGTASLVHGFGAEVGPVMAGHTALRGISFTGSTATGHALARATAGRNVRLQLEMGGKNSLLVLADAALTYAAELAALGVRWLEEAGDPLDYDLQARLGAQFPALAYATGENLFLAKQLSATAAHLDQVLSVTTTQGIHKSS